MALKGWDKEADDPTGEIFSVLILLANLQAKTFRDLQIASCISIEIKHSKIDESWTFSK
jgi:hypothetical protein